MDKLIEPHVRRKRILRRTIFAILIVACAWAALASSLSLLRPSVARQTLRTATVDRGAIETGFDATGTVIPASEGAISSPIDARVLRVLQRAGSVVRAGDPLLELDTSSARLAIESLTDRIVQSESERQRLELQSAQTLDTFRAQREQQELDLEILRYSDQKNQRLYAEGLVSQETAKQSTVSVKKAEIELAQIDRSIESGARSSAVQIASVDAELRTLRNERAQAVRQLELAATRADRDGVLTWIVDQEGTTIRTGDVIARIADLSSYRIEGTVSDIHAAAVEPGIPVRALLDGGAIEGRVVSVDPTIDTGVVRFFVELDEGAHQALRNSMRVDLFVMTGSHDDVLRIRKGIFSDGVVYRIEDGIASRVPVRFGMTGEDEIEVVDGLAAGDEVILSDMSDFTHAREVRIK